MKNWKYKSWLCVTAAVTSLIAAAPLLYHGITQGYNGGQPNEGMGLGVFFCVAAGWALYAAFVSVPKE